MLFSFPFYGSDDADNLSGVNVIKLFFLFIVFIPGRRA
jgi:hypothetical protein